MHVLTELLAQQVGIALLNANLSCAVAESCTGGLLAAALTDIPGCSQWFECGLVTYSNTAKQTLLGVADTVLQKYGAVSAETVSAMVDGVLARTAATVSVAISGIAGPTGGTATRPVGTVWIAWGGKAKITKTQCFHFTGSRTSIRQQAVHAALHGLLEFI